MKTVIATAEPGFNVTDLESVKDLDSKIAGLTAKAQRIETILAKLKGLEPTQVFQLRISGVER